MLIWSKLVARVEGKDALEHFFSQLRFLIIISASENWWLELGKHGCGIFWCWFPNACWIIAILSSSILKEVCHNCAPLCIKLLKFQHYK